MIINTYETFYHVDACPAIVWFRDAWWTMECPQCKANANQNVEFFPIIKAMMEHLAHAHASEVNASEWATDEWEEWFAMKSCLKLGIKTREVNEIVLGTRVFEAVNREVVDSQRKNQAEAKQKRRSERQEVLEGEASGKRPKM